VKFSKSACKDCFPEGLAEHLAQSLKLRPIVPESGRRCATHWRVEKKRRSAASHERRSKSTYGLDDYWGLYKFQGSKCPICLRATGASRRLSVDHDHKTDKVRGLLCRPCNTMLGHGRDDPEFFARAVNYLESPPFEEWQNQNED
jgi:hypothetical protein